MEAPKCPKCGEPTEWALQPGDIRMRLTNGHWKQWDIEPATQEKAQFRCSECGYEWEEFIEITTP